MDFAADDIQVGFAANLLVWLSEETGPALSAVANPSWGIPAGVQDLEFTYAISDFDGSIESAELHLIIDGDYSVYYLGDNGDGTWSLTVAVTLTETSSGEYQISAYDNDGNLGMSDIGDFYGVDWTGTGAQILYMQDHYPAYDSYGPGAADSVLMANLDTIGVSFDKWDVGVDFLADNGTVMSNYAGVLYAGYYDWNLWPEASADHPLTAYISGGGHLLYSSEEVLGNYTGWEDLSFAPGHFVYDVLGVEWVGNDYNYAAVTAYDDGGAGLINGMSEDAIYLDSLMFPLTGNSLADLCDPVGYGTPDMLPPIFLGLYAPPNGYYAGSLNGTSAFLAFIMAQMPDDQQQILLGNWYGILSGDVVMPPVTDFSAYPTEGYTPLEVTFTDLSIAGDTNVVSWYWDFGDGATSSVQNPFHTYYVPGDYTVSLTATDANGLSDTETKVDYINVMEISTQLSGNIGGMTLTPDEEWFVLDSVWVEDGDSLTILPGTVIKFTPGIDAYLLIKRGGYIHAQGTENDPILFTSAADDPKSDDWLAFQILGKGPGQDPFWEVQEDHNAGILQYINIEYSSYGFGLINIGSGTQIDHISKAYSVAGFYILGGNVDLSYIAANGIRATALYCDGGYTGNIDELYINGAFRGIDIDNIHGAYWDYDEQLDPDIQPRTNPTISHLTLTNIQTWTIHFRKGGVGSVSDVIIYDYSWNYGGGIRCNDEYLLNEISIDNIQHYDWHRYYLTNGSNAEQVVTNVFEDDPIFDGFVPTNSDGRGAMTEGDWLSTWGSYIPLDEIAHVYLNWIDTVMPGDTIETKLCFGLSEGNLLSSADIDIYYNPYLFEVLNVERNPDFFPDNEISVIYNVVNDTIHLSLASDGDLDTDEAWEAVLLQFEVINTYQDTTVYDIEPVSILVNENSVLYTDFYKGAGVKFLFLSLGDVSQNGEITSYDASLILQYMVGNTDLDAAQLWNADVSGYEGVSAYDASLIQQYMVGLIDIFPADTGAYAAPAEGFITMEDQTILSGQPVEVQLTLTDGDNILSFEESVVYNPDHLTFIEVEWSDVLNDFLIESNDQDGELQFAGSGSLPDGQEGLFATFHFVVNEDFEEDETVVTLQRLRWNEEEAMENSAWATLTNQLAIGNEAIPIEYRLAQNYPNPFNPVTLIKYDLPEQSHVNIVIYDMLGRQVRTLVNIIQEAGFKSVLWNATNDYGKPVSAGVYLYQIHAGEFVQTKKMVLLK
tara:strand:- start:255 stop:3929 length:3675 start_codon:yes stop_codon:yes gene_type:complete